MKILNALLSPIIKGEVALKEFVDHDVVPDLPITYTDEVGEMLKNIQYTIECLDEVDKEKQDIIELISHDLRTPILQSLDIITFLNDDGDDPEQRAENLSLLSEIVTKQLKFLEEMLKALKAKHIEIGYKNFESIPVSSMINKIIYDYKKRIEVKHLSVINTIPEHVKLHGHSLGMKQVFENLLNNAIKFSEKNGEIHISEISDKNSVQIIIQDQGTGFNERTKDTLFSKFVPGHLGTSGEPTTGLGLYLTKKIVEKHAGTIEPFSEGQGKGAKFVVSIPA
ncbi:sensor histidine kinase [Bizionia arctica]|uniref:sensor histidine kinase n=1 Tax=Bizionia arctica TaxID=1495645 RepID=UPI0016631EA5|nr:HAMP domain-containing sensor histidine kinase [Bizionia arctica]